MTTKPEIIKSIILWDVTPCSLAELHRHFEGTSVEFYRAARRYIPQYITILSHRCDNLNLDNQFFSFVA
jgi:hypothetical protein